MRPIERRISAIETERDRARPDFHVIPGRSVEEREAKRRELLRTGAARPSDLFIFILKGLGSSARDEVGSPPAALG